MFGPIRVLTFTVFVAMGLGACKPSVTTADNTDPAMNPPPAQAMTPSAQAVTAEAAPASRPSLPSAPPLPEGADVTYQCVDGNEVTVTYTYVSARLRWPDGRKLNLSRTASTSKNGDVYAGNRASLEHDGTDMRLTQDGAATVTCSEASSTA
jgi:hypothetical protein